TRTSRERIRRAREFRSSTRRRSTRPGRISSLFCRGISKTKSSRRCRTCANGADVSSCPFLKSKCSSRRSGGMKILLTGTEGYIGCVLAPRLLEAGHQVVGLDTGYYRDGWLFSDPVSMPRVPQTLVKDVRHVDLRDLEGVDAVVHLAELSNDPLGENDPKVTF